MLTAVLLVLVLLISAGLTVIALGGPWSSSALGPMAAMSALTAGIIALDLITGSHLQISSIFGLQPLLGGRFYGMGNVAFALYGSAVILLCAALAHALRRRGAPRLAVAVVLAVSGVALAVDVLPAWGADFGGPIALVPALGILLLGVMQVRATWRTVGVVVLVAALVVGLVCYLDWRRPVDERSHPGRFLQTVIDGGAFDVMSRRLVGNIEAVLSVPLLAVVVTVLLAMCVLVVARPGALRTEPLARLFVGHPCCTARSGASSSWPRSASSPTTAAPRSRRWPRSSRCPSSSRPSCTS